MNKFTFYQFKLTPPAAAGILRASVDQVHLPPFDDVVVLLLLHLACSFNISGLCTNPTVPSAPPQQHPSQTFKYNTPGEMVKRMDLTLGPRRVLLTCLLCLVYTLGLGKSSAFLSFLVAYATTDQQQEQPIHLVCSSMEGALSPPSPS